MNRCDECTGPLFATDFCEEGHSCAYGRLGKDMPPDELNRAAGKGLHFGYPYRHGKDISDPEFGGKAPAWTFTPPALELGAHVASLGLHFYTGAMFPQRYSNRLFIAEHGSWNRIIPAGYRIVMVRVKNRYYVANAH